MLSRAFAHTLPSTDQELLLVAALPTGAQGRAALGALLARHATLEHLTTDDRELLPLLLDGVEANGAALPNGLRSVLRAARLHEELRGAKVAAECAAVLATRARRGEPVVVLGGASVAERLYGGWSVRHFGALELLGPADDVERRASGLRVVTRRTLLPHGGRTDVGTPETVRATVAGQPALVLASPTFVLERLAGPGAHREPSGWWAADVVRLLATQPDLDWDAVLHGARRTRSLLALWLRGRWLAEHLGAPVPHQVLAAARRGMGGEAATALTRGVARQVRRRAGR